MRHPQRRYPNGAFVGNGWAECLHVWDDHECMVGQTITHETHRCACGALSTPIERTPR